MINREKPIVVERLLHASADRVWKAITEKEKMKEWYFDLKEFEAVPGFEFSFSGQNKTGDKEYLHLCKVLESVKDKKLSYSWRYKDYEGNSLVSFELLPANGEVLLRLTHEGLHTFPRIEDFARENFVEGWTQIIAQLEHYLDKHSAVL
jgi:uncharacterized protein YndB with AHSA1/START domain